MPTKELNIGKALELMEKDCEHFLKSRGGSYTDRGYLSGSSSTSKVSDVKMPPRKFRFLKK